jgi:hypothetical protein
VEEWQINMKSLVMKKVDKECMKGDVVQGFREWVGIVILGIDLPD